MKNGLSVADTIRMMPGCHQLCPSCENDLLSDDKVTFNQGSKKNFCACKREFIQLRLPVPKYLLGTGQNLSGTRAVTIDRGAKTFFRKNRGAQIFFEKN